MAKINIMSEFIQEEMTETDFIPAQIETLPAIEIEYTLSQELLALDIYEPVKNAKVLKFEEVLKIQNPQHNEKCYFDLVQQPTEFYDTTVEYLDRVRIGINQGKNLEQSKIQAINQMWTQHSTKFKELL